MKEIVIKNEFVIALIRGIKLKEGFDSEEDVLLEILKEHMDNLEDSEPSIEDIVNSMYSYSTQATDK